MLIQNKIQILPQPARESNRTQARFGVIYLLYSFALKRMRRRPEESPFKRSYQVIITRQYMYTRICASLGLRMKFKTLFISDEENTAIILISHSSLIIIFIHAIFGPLPGGLYFEC